MNMEDIPNNLHSFHCYIEFNRMDGSDVLTV